MTDICLLYMTASDADEAQKIASSLLEEKLVACVNILPSATSLYWWEGNIEENTETVLIAKTQETLASKVEERVKALHSYDCPCVVSVPITDSNTAFCAWVGEVTGDT